MNKEDKFIREHRGIYIPFDFKKEYECYKKQLVFREKHTLGHYFYAESYLKDFKRELDKYDLGYLYEYTSDMDKSRKKYLDKVVPDYIYENWMWNSYNGKEDLIKLWSEWSNVGYEDLVGSILWCMPSEKIEKGHCFQLEEKIQEFVSDFSFYFM